MDTLNISPTFGWLSETSQLALELILSTGQERPGNWSESLSEESCLWEGQLQRFFCILGVPQKTLETRPRLDMVGDVLTGSMAGGFRGVRSSFSSLANISVLGLLFSCLLAVPMQKVPRKVSYHVHYYHSPRNYHLHTCFSWANVSRSQFQ